MSASCPAYHHSHCWPACPMILIAPIPILVSNISILSLVVGDAAILLSLETRQGESVLGTGSTQHSGEGREERMDVYDCNCVRFVCTSGELDSASDDCVGVGCMGGIDERLILWGGLKFVW